MGGTFVHDQAKHLMKAGCELKVIVPRPYCPKIMTKIKRWSKYAGIPERDTIDGIGVHYPSYFRLPGKWFHAPSCYTEYLGLKNVADAIIKEFKPDVIHAHAATAAGVVGIMLKNKYSLPLVCSLHGSDINTYPYYGGLSMQLTKKVLGEADLLISVSSALKDAANSIAKTKNEIRVVYNASDDTIFFHRRDQRSRIRQEFGISEMDKALLFVGSVSRDKGVPELMDAFMRVHSDNPGLHLFIVGKGTDIATLSNVVASCRSQDTIHLIGEVPHDDIADFMSAADIFVLPSHSEGMPCVVLEAMACGLPVVATRVGGIPEAVEDGKSGILVPVKDTDSLTKAINFMDQNEYLAQQMGVRGRKIAKSKFSWGNNARKTIDIYKEAADARS